LLEKKIMVREISQDRAVALDMAFLATRLLDEKNFPRVIAALNTKSVRPTEDFKTLCEELGIPPELMAALWKSFRTYALALPPKAPWAP
jgi:hypothetical protein